ncbi:substrate-binding periplasmic protein [Haloimpatiens sp. FM7315]|uniref:substrate-binding periplasmic protein n=1 Tax=Haloimpatiens sp. FM7315 TaxID=3298609 RepID=UPI00370A0A9B
MTKIHKKLVVLIIIIVNCIIIMMKCNAGTNSTIASNVDVKDRLELIKEKGVLTELNTNEDIDMIVDGMRITDERKKEVLFTDVWYRDSDAIVVPKFSKIIDKRDLKNSVIGAREGTLALELAQKWQKEGLIKELKLFKSQSELLSAVNTGKVDAIIMDSSAASYILPKDRTLYLKTLTIYEPEIFGDGAAAVRKSDTTLANAVNEKIDEMKNDKTFFKILEKYGLK